MAGHGPPPKDPKTRARRNKTEPLRVIHAEPVPQPELPDGLVIDDDLFIWPAITREWWQMWGASPLAADFTETDWSELLVTALIHAKFWQGDTKQAAELRLRVAKFGATPEDRARLKITFAQAADATGERGTRQSASRERYGGLKLAGSE